MRAPTRGAPVPARLSVVTRRQGVTGQGAAGALALMVALGSGLLASCAETGCCDPMARPWPVPRTKGEPATNDSAPRAAVPQAAPGAIRLSSSLAIKPHGRARS